VEARQVTQRGKEGFSLIEVCVAIGIVGIMVATAVPQFGAWTRAQRVKDATRELARAFITARSEAIRTGNNHIVFLQNDALGNPLVDAQGRVVPILILDDNRTGDPTQNCRIDAGESITTILGHSSISWGVATATIPVPSDTGGGDFTTGSSFSDGGANDTTWVLFGPQGMPATFTTACVIGGLASGGGAAYVSDGTRDYAAVVNPLGGVRIHSWDTAVNAWRN